MGASEKQYQLPHITRVEPEEDGWRAVCSCGKWKTDILNERVHAVSAAYFHRMAKEEL